MPIENERKYILSLTPDHIDDLVHDYGGIHQYIRQAYVGGARVRGVLGRGGGLPEELIFTWKKRRVGGSRIEIETVLSEDDFNELWKASKTIITKQRIKIKGYGITWDVDFLFSGENIADSHYLTIAEVEMPDGMDAPTVLPDFVNDHFLYLVPRYKEEMWVNPKLTDPKHVKKMLKDALKEGK